MIKFPMDKYTASLQKKWNGKLVSVKPTYWASDGVRLLDENGSWRSSYLTFNTIYLFVTVSGDGLPSPAIKAEVLFPDGVLQTVFIHVHHFDDLTVHGE
jgi:hypothetical protein